MIEVNGVTKCYQLGVVSLTALRGVSFRIEAGELVALLGASGSGTSTLLNILGCLEAPTTGSYRLDGTEVSRLRGAQLAAVRNRTMGFVVPRVSLLPRLDALANVELPLVRAGSGSAASQRQARQALAAVGLADQAHLRPHELSAGQQQRVAIARALVTAPQVILAAEPTGTLDAGSRTEIMCLFQRLTREQGITVVVATREADVAAATRRILRLQDGVIESDEPVRTRRPAGGALGALQTAGRTSLAR